MFVGKVSRSYWIINYKKLRFFPIQVFYILSLYTQFSFNKVSVLAMKWWWNLQKYKLWVFVHVSYLLKIKFKMPHFAAKQGQQLKVTLESVQN